MSDVCEWLMEDHSLSGAAPGGMVNYRKALVQSLFVKFYMEVASAKGNEENNMLNEVIYNALFLIH